MRGIGVLRGVRRLAGAGVIVVASLLLAAPAYAGVSITVAPASAVAWTMAPAATNQKSGGTITVNSTANYVLAVTADVARLREHNGSAYVANGRTIAAALNVKAVRTGGTAVIAGVPKTAVIGTSTTLATGTGLGTDTYAITLEQLTTIADPVLPAGRAYRAVLTYTVSSVL